MSLEIETPKEPGQHGRDASERSTLSLDIPASELSSSASSSGPPSPNPLADSDIHTLQSTPSETPPPSTSRHASTSSLTSTTLSVKFAPLPELAPRRRRSSTPLGMAARGQLMRRKKLQMTAQQQLYEQQVAANPNMTPEQLEANRLHQEELAARYAHIQASAAASIAREEEARLEQEEEELERHQMMKAESRKTLIAADEMDVKLLSLGKTVKTFWKKVAHHRDSDSEVEGMKEKEREKDVDNKLKEGTKVKAKVSSIKRKSSGPLKRGGESSLATAVPPPPVPPLRPILAAITTPNIDATNLNSTNAEKEFAPVESPVEESGGVWEEEIANDFPLNVSQTETIVEGRPVHSPEQTTPTVTTTKVEVMTVKSKAEESQTQTSKRSPRKSLLSKSPPTKGKSLLGSAKS
ncbi:hypothetical protein CPB84DRAFT_1742783 [Gymnopilus junonius]|uniref:Uncharacterized protein n=1 Tax=Gymnopilus junonius TaxID=109634 RepID=A0A9P5NZY4_GYMJU|nr:hypothetical protein CPB84DRAFT_1742783 [Gymnopilus junonius]